MRHLRPGRLLVAIVLLFGFYLAWQRLSEQDVPAADVFSTGILFVVILGAFFLFLLGAGKLLGKLFGRD